MYTNLFDAAGFAVSNPNPDPDPNPYPNPNPNPNPNQAGFTVSAIWNPWASACAKRGDFATVLYSQALSPEPEP